MPTAAYQVDYFTISKDGTLSFDDRTDSDEVELLVEALLERGFEPEPRFRVRSLSKASASVTRSAAE